MNQLFLQKGISKELEQFPQILEFAIKRNTTIQLNSFNEECTNSIRVFFILEGKFEWIINQKNYILYPDDLVVIQPGQSFGGTDGILNIGKLCWISVQVNDETTNRILFDKWSNIPQNEILAISKILLLSNMPVMSKIKEAERIFTCIHTEFFNQQIGFTTQINHLLDELFILIARKLTLQNNVHRDFPQVFMNLEQTLRKNLSHQWTVEEMAALVGLGTTTFTEKAKQYSGFSPLSYLITIRISEAIKMLKQNELNLTDIALDTGFYSSQHFSTTFKKLTGYTPSDFRKKNTTHG